MSDYDNNDGGHPGDQSSMDNIRSSMDLLNQHMMMTRQQQQMSPLMEFPAPTASEYLEHNTDKSWGEKLVGGVGGGYASGAVVGLTWGFTEGLKNGKGLPTKIKLNAILNACGKRGGRLANGAAGAALLFHLCRSISMLITRKDDLGDTTIGGASAGLLFNCLAGPKWIAAGSVGGAVAAFAYGLYNGESVRWRSGGDQRYAATQPSFMEMVKGPQEEQERYGGASTTYSGDDEKASQ
eukprot:TRINITY_DN3743_c0_g1_i2.p1 TRINITY_DN3743_c0_g1~~TRINITY_DN3743_c0_g1_i2.p1  ORF type:complete len:238 (-),score=38.91 TRINITY_DN3743_c0_g1_i2:100-813(-)